MNYLIEMLDISKTFDKSIALDSVSLKLKPGSVHALVGENGAGKSTLMKVLAGVVQPDSGTVTKRGVQLKLDGPREAIDSGISTVFQELSLLPNLSVAENMFLGKEPLTRWGTVDQKRMEHRAAQILQGLGVVIEPATLTADLTIAERQFVEIAHGISAAAEVIILDEPTAALNAADVAILKRQIQLLKDEGKAVIYISHRMEEIFEICDTASVLKDGRNVATHEISDLTPESLIAMMVGRDIEALYPERGKPGDNEVLTIRDLKLSPTSDRVSIAVRQGEIVGLAGLEGQGQREIVRSLIGDYQPVRGSVTIRGTKVDLPTSGPKGVRRLQDMKVGFVPEDRKDEGLFLKLGVAHNICIGLHAVRSELAWAKHYRQAVDTTISSMAIKTASPDVPVVALSGGNQQKALLGRYLASDADILLVEEPTRGVDVGSKAEIYTLLRSFCESGGAVLVLSRETIELIGLCDRLYVVHNKTVVSEMSTSDATEHKILDVALADSSVRHQTNTNGT